jgi:hypothetical protein
VVTFIIFSTLFLILRRHVRGFEVACPYERDQKFQGKGTITGLDEAINSSACNGVNCSSYEGIASVVRSCISPKGRGRGK